MPSRTEREKNKPGGFQRVFTDESGLERLIFFSDAVFAIAITLLALDIRLPGDVKALTDQELSSALLALWPKYLSYAISFLVIGGFWLSHHRHYRYIKAYDRRLMMLNLFLLLVVAFIPFPTAVISENGNRTGTIFYSLVIALAGLLSALAWVYASYKNRLTEPLEPREAHRMMINGFIVPGVFLVSIGLAFIDPDLAKYSWILTALVGLNMR